MNVSFIKSLIEPTELVAAQVNWEMVTTRSSLYCQSWS